MVVKIDISHPPSNIRKIIIDGIEINKSKFAGNSSDVDYGTKWNNRGRSRRGGRRIDTILHIFCYLLVLSLPQFDVL